MNRIIAPNPHHTLFANTHIVKPYNNVRPDIYKPATQKILEYMFDVGLYPHSVLDVGCGTGRSTIEFKDISHSVVGIDPSLEMLGEALDFPNVTFGHGSAENIPLDDRFDLVVSAMTFRYFNKLLFFKELDRLLKEDGLFVIYECKFGGEIGNHQFQKWLDGELFKRYPEKNKVSGKIQENPSSMPAEKFQLVHFATYKMFESYTPERYTSYLLSKSNFSGLDSETIYELRQEILERIKSYWGGPEQLIKFNGTVKFISRTSSDIAKSNFAFHLRMFRKRLWYLSNFKKSLRRLNSLLS